MENRARLLAWPGNGVNDHGVSPGPECGERCVIHSEYTGISSLMELIPYIYRVNFEISVCNVFPPYCYDTPIQLQYRFAIAIPVRYRQVIARHSGTD
jgi:hypothetical protein